MPRRKGHGGLPPPDPARKRWLQKAGRQVAADCRAARKCESWSAVAALHRQGQSLRLEYDLARAAERAAVEEADEAAPEAMTPEEWGTLIDEDAAAASDDDLERYVIEWARRLGLTFDGTTSPPTLRRVGLRLVEGD